MKLLPKAGDFFGAGSVLLRHLEVLWGAGSVEQGPPDSSEVVGCDGGQVHLLSTPPSVSRLLPPSTICS